MKTTYSESHVLNESLGFLVNAVAKSMRSALEEKLKPYKINSTQWVVMQGLADNTSITQTELGKRVELDSPTITKTIDKLENAGLLRRVAAKDDRRAQLVKLTPKGRRLLPDISEAATEVNKLASKGMRAAKYKTFLNELTHIRNNLQNNSLP